MFSRKTSRYYDWVVNRDMREKEKEKSKRVNHTQLDFQEGIYYKAKLVGFKEISRPNDRMEIVAAMRDIRLNYKKLSVKKHNVIICVSTQGIKVTLASNKSNRSKSMKCSKPEYSNDTRSLIQETNSDGNGLNNLHLKSRGGSVRLDIDTRKQAKLNQLKKYSTSSPLENTQYIVMQDHINRVFYVSHDSQDLQIWSYIAQDINTQLFKCCVFKSFQKKDAVRIVHTIGQAFDICHKISRETAEDIVLNGSTMSKMYSESGNINQNQNHDISMDLKVNSFSSDNVNINENEVPCNSSRIVEVHNNNSVSSKDSEMNNELNYISTYNNYNNNIKIKDKFKNLKFDEKTLTVTGIFNKYLEQIKDLEDEQIRIERGYMLRKFETEQALVLETNIKFKNLTKHNVELIKNLKQYVAYIYELESIIQIHVPKSFEILENLRNSNPAIILDQLENNFGKKNIHALEPIELELGDLSLIEKLGVECKNDERALRKSGIDPHNLIITKTETLTNTSSQSNSPCLPIHKGSLNVKNSKNYDNINQKQEKQEKHEKQAKLEDKLSTHKIIDTDKNVEATLNQNTSIKTEILSQSKEIMQNKTQNTYTKQSCPNKIPTVVPTPPPIYNSNNASNTLPKLLFPPKINKIEQNLTNVRSETTSNREIHNNHLTENSNYFIYANESLASINTITVAFVIKVMTKSQNSQKWIKHNQIYLIKMVVAYTII